jgi:hypothetical protein
MSHSEGPGWIRAVARRVYEDGVFKWLYSADDVATASHAFAERVDMESTRVARGELPNGRPEAIKARARELALEAFSLDKASQQGQNIRDAGIADAMKTTYTNDSRYAKILLSVRDALNKNTGNWRFGDFAIPWVKTISNIAKLGLDMSGLSAVEGIWKMPHAMRELRRGNSRPLSDIIGLWSRNGMGILFALLLANSVDPDDFVGDYDKASPKEKERAAMINAPFNSVKVGNTWVSLDIFGPIAAPFVGFMEAKKEKEGWAKAARYGQGVVTQLTKVPGFSQMQDLVTTVGRMYEQKDAGASIGVMADEMFNQVRTRIVPTFAGHLASATDVTQRETSYQRPEGPAAMLPVGGLARTAALIPGLRQTLPPKISQITGEQVATDNALTTLLLGNRMKTARDNEVISEINRLFKNNAAPSIANIENSYADVRDMRKQIGEKNYAMAMAAYGQTYYKLSDTVMQLPGYQKLTDEKKADALNKNRKKAVQAMLAYAAKHFGYKPTKKVTK